MGMRSLGVYTGRGWEACHEFHAVAIIMRKKYGKFLNTNVQVPLFSLRRLKIQYLLFLCFGKLIPSNNILRTTYQDGAIE